LKHANLTSRLVKFRLQPIYTFYGIGASALPIADFATELRPKLFKPIRISYKKAKRAWVGLWRPYLTDKCFTGSALSKTQKTARGENDSRGP
jgi:hypothetical protein